MPPNKEQEGSDNIQQPEPGWVFNPEENSSNESTAEPANKPEVADSIGWSASEFIAHNKNSGWYFALAGGAGLLSLAIFFLTKDLISSIVVVIVAIVFGVFAARKPRELQYYIDNTGLKIAEKFYPYSDFKSFSVIQEDGIESIWFMPLKRFMPIISVYFDPNDGQKIADVLSQYLPFENRQPDPVDKLMRRLRF